MTVKELIEKLYTFDLTLNVLIEDDCGYGNISSIELMKYTDTKPDVIISI